MIHLAARTHAFVNGLFRPKDERVTRELYDNVSQLYRRRELDEDGALTRLAIGIAEDVYAALEVAPSEDDFLDFAALVTRLFSFEVMYELPRIDWTERRSVSEYWEIRDHLKLLRRWLEDFDETRDFLVLALSECLGAILRASPSLGSTSAGVDEVAVMAERVRAIDALDKVVETVLDTVFSDQLADHELFRHHRVVYNNNVLIASGGNPADPATYKRMPKWPTKSDVKDPVELVDTYLGQTPLQDLFSGKIKFTIPNSARFEHHHIVAGTGHGKSQTLQYLIAEDLPAVERGERSVIVLDSHGDLISNISRLKLFAPGSPLHDRVVIIDPTDVEYPVSLNLFDIGIERLDEYSQLDRERLTNTILELYDFVLGSLLSAEMTQKQNVIFRYVTRLMLHIPDATIHTFRELMEPDSDVKFAEHISKLTGTARDFFETEFNSREFTQTRRQVLRRLWGILENQTFNRMFSHPRSKFDLYSEMNAGKVILINTAKDLLKEQGTEIFGRFFIALVAQAAQERATLPESERTPTFVYIDEAADYFDRNIGLILSQARKYNVGMVLAHQYLGQLDPKLQEAFGANTSIKFAGGVSARDARTLAPMLYCDPTLIESQPKGNFAAYIRGVTKSALPLTFPFGHMEAMDQMTADEQVALRDVMRSRYAVHLDELDDASDATTPSDPDDDDSEDGGNGGPDIVDTRAKSEW